MLGSQKIVLCIDDKCHAIKLVHYNIDRSDVRVEKLNLNTKIDVMIISTCYFHLV